MAYLEIWTSKPAWLKARTAERTRLVDDLSRVIALHLEHRKGLCGPFEHCEPNGSCVLVWEINPDHAKPVNEGYARTGLHRYFERLMCGPFGNLSAKDYWERISK